SFSYKFFTLSLHDALPIWPNAIINIIAVLITMVLLLVLYAAEESIRKQASQQILSFFKYPFLMIFTIEILFLVLNYIDPLDFHRSEEHTSELQSRFDLVCR